MITCERCNTENLDGSQYCDECGAPLSASTPPKVKKSTPTGETESASKAEPKSEPKAEPNGSGAPEPPAPAIKKTEVAARGAHAFAVSSGSIAMMEGAHAKLVIERGRSAGKQFPLSDDESQIGRWDADGGIFPDVDLDADDPEAKVSRRHARIMRRNSQYYIEDLGSTNGTFINRGRRLLPGDRQSLRDGDEIIVGKTFLRFHIVK
jgi:hypothetical protein